VRLRYAADGVEIEVSDDGGHRTAREPSRPPGHGHGLAGMAERAAAFDGALTAAPCADGPGWRVHARLRPAEPA